MQDIAEAIGRHFHLPVVAKSTEEAADHFGFSDHSWASISQLPAQNSLELPARGAAKLADVGLQVGYETDAAFNKAIRE